MNQEAQSLLLCKEQDTTLLTQQGIAETPFPRLNSPGDSAECEQEWRSWEWQPLYAVLAIC